MMSISDKIQIVLHHIQECAQEANRQPNSVQLLAVSKGQSSEKIAEAFAAGLHHFGENYWQELSKKITSLAHLPIHWHFLGPIQGNKARSIAEHCSWVHSLTRESIAKKFNEARTPDLPRLNVCLQVNIDNEATKSGLAVHELDEMARIINAFPRLHLRGLMCIPAPIEDASRQYERFLFLKSQLDRLNRLQHLSMDTLSMGMSGDYKAAIRAGSTIVRIGQAIFGARR